MTREETALKSVELALELFKTSPERNGDILNGAYKIFQFIESPDRAMQERRKKASNSAADEKNHQPATSGNKENDYWQALDIGKIKEGFIHVNRLSD